MLPSPPALLEESSFLRLDFFECDTSKKSSLLLVLLGETPRDVVLAGVTALERFMADQRQDGQKVKDSMLLYKVTIIITLITVLNEAARSR